MKNNLRIVSVVIVSFLVALPFSCKKEAPKVIPSISTTTPTNITSSTAACGGTISADGGAPVTSRGVCWGLNQSPTTSDNKTSDGSGIGSFTSSISGLIPGTAYYVRAYATNSIGTAYGNQVVSTTMSTLPTITTTAVTNITSTTATSGGFISFEGGSPVISRGVCWSKNQNPTIADNKTANGTGSSSFVSLMNGLTPATTYFVKSFATNSMGTVYGSQLSFETGKALSLAIVTTSAASNVTSSGAILGGNVTSDGNTSVTEKGIVYSTTQNPTTSNLKVSSISVGIGAYSVNVINFSPNTSYYVRAYAINSQGTAYGSQISFTTGVLPVVEFAAITTTIRAGQSIQFTDLSTSSPKTWSWDFGDGRTSTNKNPLHTYEAAGIYTVKLTATNSYGSNTGTKANFITVNLTSEQIIFNPDLIYGSVTDIDGNTYKTISIGTQTWMAENLKTTKYRNGDLIGTTTPATLDITTESNPKYQWGFLGKESFVNTYGRLYTWYAATDFRNVCPSGWHLPSDTEWTALSTYLGGERVAGGKLKEAGTSHWDSLDPATNSSGFTALPSGFRQRYSDYSEFGGIGKYGSWWSSTGDGTNAIYRTINYYMSDLIWNTRGTDKKSGFSVRCVKDN